MVGGVKCLVITLLLLSLGSLRKGKERPKVNRITASKPQQRKLLLNNSPIAINSANEDDMTSAELFDNSSVIHTTDLQDADEFAGFTGDTPMSSDELLRRVDPNGTLEAPGDGLRDIDETAEQLYVFVIFSVQRFI